jgi:hypothetical protein
MYDQLRFESDGDAYRNYSRTYKGDVSLCVPTAVEVSRLTRWQLVFEPYRSGVTSWSQFTVDG